MKTEKYTGEIVFINDIDLGITDYKKETDRPCIILHYDDLNEEYYLIHMTTQRGVDDDPNRNQYQVACGSFVKLNSEPKVFEKNFIDYSESPSYDKHNEYEVSDVDLDFIIDNYKHFW